MEEKRFMLMPATHKDTLPEEKDTILTRAVYHYLDGFKSSNIGIPINFADFAVMKRSGDSLIVHMVFEIDPDYLDLSGRINKDSILYYAWNEWFRDPLEKIPPGRNQSYDNIHLFFSLISGDKQLSIRHLPGIDVRDERKVRVYSYVTNQTRVTVTTTYYETEVDPTFNTSLELKNRYYELLYHVNRNQEEDQFSIKNKALNSFKNGELKTEYSTFGKLPGNSFLISYLNHIHRK